MGKIWALSAFAQSTSPLARFTLGMLPGINTLKVSGLTSLEISIGIDLQPLYVFAGILPR